MFSSQELAHCIQQGRSELNDANLANTIIILNSWILLCYVRCHAGDRKAKADLAIFIVAGFGYCFRYLSEAWSCTHLPRIALYSCFSIHFLILLQFPVKPLGEEDEQKDLSNGKPGRAAPTPGKYENEYPAFLKPLILPCRTAHTRYFPKKHSFSYTYFFVGIPVEFEGNINGILSAGKVNNSHGWFHVNPDDYLQRTNSNDYTLRQKLDAYLNTQGIDPSTYHYAYFVTGPRFLGYSFNPVSFWYLYNANHGLAAMILEVNNTFDERRMYLLHAPPNTATPTSDDDSNGDSNGNSEKVQKAFTNTWTKDFHVSPFNDREGAYSLTANDMWAHNRPGRVSNSVDLRTPSQELKLNARVFSTGREIDPESLNLGGKVSLLAQWGGIGFLTFPRILREAWTLYVKRGLQVWFRPEVTRKSIGRQPTSEEIILERFFRRYLAHLVSNCGFPLELTYQPAGGMTLQPKYTFTSLSQGPDAQKADPDLEPDTRTLEIHIISPAFYSRFVQYAHTSEAFDREYLFTHDKNKTVYVSAPGVLHEVLARGANGLAHRSRNSTKAGWSWIPDSARWKVVQALRSNPAQQSYLDEGSSGSTETKKEATRRAGKSDLHSRSGGSQRHDERAAAAAAAGETTNNDRSTVAATEARTLTATHDIRRSRQSPLDIYVRAHERSASSYRRTVTKLFLADRFCFGLPSVLDWADAAMRLLLTVVGVWACATSLQQLASPAGTTHHSHSHSNSHSNSAGGGGATLSISVDGGPGVDTSITNARGFVNQLSARAAAEQATTTTNTNTTPALLLLRGLLLTNAAHVWSLLIKGVV